MSDVREIKDELRDLKEVINSLVEGVMEKVRILEGKVEKIEAERDLTAGFVAAKDTPSSMRGRSDYICDGEKDEVEILSALGYCRKVYLLPGTYHISKVICLKGD